MWRKKKFIVMLLITVVVIAASFGGVALAQESEDSTQPDTLMGRVSKILGIEQQTLEDAFDQVRTEMQAEAMDRHLQNLVDEGVITEEQAAEYKEWLESRPDTTEYDEQIKEWMESKPDIPGIPRSRSFGMTRGMDGMRMFDGLCLPGQ